MKIKIDDIDLGILKILNKLPTNNEESYITTTSIAKQIFPGLNRKDLIIKDNIIRRRLVKLNRDGLIRMSNEKISEKKTINFYDLIANNCYVGILKNKKAIYLNINKKWCAVNI